MLSKKQDLITQSELAKRLDVSIACISKGMKSGRFKVFMVGTKKLLNYRDCKRVYIETRTNSGTPKHKVNTPIKKTKVKPVSDVSKKRPPPPEPEAPHDLHDARLKLEKYKSMKEQLNYEIMQGKYISIDDVSDLLSKLAQNLKKSILAIPARVGPIIAGETDAHKVRQLMIVEFKNSLQSVVDTNTLEEKLKK